MSIPATDPRSIALTKEMADRLRRYVIALRRDGKLVGLKLPEWKRPEVRK